MRIPGISIRYLKLDQQGNFLVSPQTISIHDNNNYPHMAMDSMQYLHVVWHLENPMGIMYAKLDTMGNYVISPMLVVYQPYAVWPLLPRIAVDRSNRLHLVWTDQRLGSEDVYYKRGENEIGIREASQSLPGKSLVVTITPNPFIDKTDIRWQTRDDSDEISLKMFDISGTLVRDFSDRTAGILHQSGVRWDGKDTLGDRLPGGVYFLRLECCGEIMTEKVILLR